MKNKYLLSLLWVIVSGFGILMAQEIAIIPQPAHLIVKNESFKFGKQLKVCIASYRGDSVTLVFDSFKDDFQKATGIKVTSVRSEAKAGIVLSVNQTLAPEAYKLDVSPKQIRIEVCAPCRVLLCTSNIEAVNLPSCNGRGGSRRPAGVEYSDRRNRRCSPFRMEGLYAGRGQALFRKKMR